MIFVSLLQVKFFNVPKLSTFWTLNVDKLYAIESVEKNEANSEIFECLLTIASTLTIWLGNV